MRKEFSELKTTPSSSSSSSVGYLKQDEHLHLQDGIENVKILVVSESSPGGDSQTIEDLVRRSVGAEEEEGDQSVGLLGLARSISTDSGSYHPSIYSEGLLRMSSELGSETEGPVAVQSGGGGGVITLASSALGASSSTVVVSTGHVGGATSVINHHSSSNNNSNNNSHSASHHLGFTYEHPLTAATTAMLNINGNPEDPSGNFGILYDYYGKLQSGGGIADATTGFIKTERTINADIWSPVPVTAVGNTVQSKINGEMFVTSDSLGKGGSYVTDNEIPLQATSVIVRRGGDPGGDGKESPALISHSTLKLITSSSSEHHHHSVTPADIVPPLPRDLVTVKHEVIRNGGSPQHHHQQQQQQQNGVTVITSECNPDPHNPHHQQFYASSPQLFASLSSSTSNGTNTNGQVTTVMSNGAHNNGNVNGGYEQYIPTVVVVSAPSPSSHHHHSTSTTSTPGIYTVTSPTSEYYYGDGYVGTTSRVISPYDGPSSFGNLDRYRTASVAPTYKPVAPVTVDLPSPDSGIEAGSITPRDHANIQPGFEYNETCPIGIVNDVSGPNSNSNGGRTTPAAPKSTRPWHEFGRQSENDKIQIPKLFSNYGFRYYLESPISTSQRREDDRITYINKGQFYGISLEYIPDTEKPLKSQTVKSVVMLVFREEKSPEDETKAWQFWHSRQHSVKQRILDADTKNSVGLVGCIEEVAHNAIAVYWNPLESSAKINVAVQCLSTDFSSQKGVKGLPLHLQIDTYDEFRDPNSPVIHRGYGQIKVFCDKGAERKTRDEERRAAKRKLTATGRKKLDEMYHTPCDRSEFYAMSDIAKPPVLFSPAEDIDKLNSMELHSFYNTHTDEHSSSSAADLNQPPSSGGRLGGGGEGDQSPRSCGSTSGPATPTPLSSSSSVHNFPSSHGPPPPLPPPQPQQVLKFHNTFPPESPPAPAHQNHHNHHHHPLPPPPPSHSYIRAPPHHHQQPPPPLNLVPIHHSQHAPILHHPLPPPQPLHHPPPPPSAPLSLGSRQHDSPPPPQPPRPASSPAQSQKTSIINDPIKNGITTNNNKDTTVVVLDTNGVTNDSMFGSPACKRMRLMPPVQERLMLYVRQEQDEAFTPLHLVPPSTLGLLSALEDKFKISMGSVKNLHRRNMKGITAKIDDEMLKHYCQEDCFHLEVMKPSENDDALDITLVEMLTDMHSSSQPPHQPPPLVQVSHSS